MAISRKVVAIYDIYKSGGAGWVELPVPSEYIGISTTLVDSGRNTQGQVIADVIKSDVAKVELKWNFLSAKDFSDIAKLFEPKHNNNDMSVFFRPVSFFDVVSNSYEGDITQAPNTTTNKIRLFYCGDRKVQFAKMVLNDDGTPKGYQNVSLNLIDSGVIYGE